MFAAGPDVVDVIIWHLAVPSLVMLAVVFALGWLACALRRKLGPPLARWWQGAALRARYRMLSKAVVIFTDGLTANALAAFFCWPLTQVPPGSGVKPMYLPLFLVILAGAGVASIKGVADTARPPGCVVLRLLGTVLCLTPLPLGVFLMHYIAAVRHLTFG